MDKVLFLDHDEVICLSAPKTDWAIPYDNKWNCQPFSKKAVKALNHVIRTTGCEIVVTSSWKNVFSLKELKEIYLANKIIKLPIAVTNTDPLATGDNGQKRAKEIEKFILENSIDIWAIIDDYLLYEHYMHSQKHFVWVPSGQGILSSGAQEQLISYLK